MFNQFLTESVTIKKANGTEFSEIKACIQPKVIVINDVTVPIEAGDIIKRKLASGIEETYVVDDPGYLEEADPVKAHYEVKAHRQGTQGEQTLGTTTNNISDPYARMSASAQDYLTDTNDAAPEHIFSELNTQLKANIFDKEELADILRAADELEKSVGSKEFTVKYSEFIMTAANHTTLIAPFVRALSQCLAKQKKP